VTRDSYVKVKMLEDEAFPSILNENDPLLYFMRSSAMQIMRLSLGSKL